MRYPVLVATLLLAGASPAFAHRLLADAALTETQFRVEAYYSDDTPAQGAKVSVLRGDEIIAEGRTDERGVWAGPRPQPGTYTVRVVSEGHAADPKSVVVPEDGGVIEPPPADREANTRTPWDRLGIGLGVIAGLAIGWLVTRRAMGKSDGG
jgi:hypothetical protein